MSIFITRRAEATEEARDLLGANYNGIEIREREYAEGNSTFTYSVRSKGAMPTGDHSVQASEWDTLIENLKMALGRQA